MRHESAFTLVQPVKTFIAENSHPIHNPQDAVPVVHDFLDSLHDDIQRHELWKAPRDKAICILNCVKLIMSVLEMTSSETGADAFIPLLTYVILQAQPPNLISNLKYIESTPRPFVRFRSPVKLRGEMAYYLTNMMVCMEFIKTADASRFNIDADEFEEQLTRQLEEMHPTPAKPRMEKPTRPPPPPPRGVTVKTISAADGGGDTDGGDDTRDRTDTITPAARVSRTRTHAFHLLLLLS
ncbi:hypothetical protein PTSG_04215 [Salpingoeca rosetta]|uniref:VPS9 domain-containing protein n=1 Tax=Salpingoeca rosetta (strain ATCC 50818 / BSB-021) TaxID=946362 RepID=F2U6X5_SALR5|nr:uncharacterized protein PTSG_04215 [Salpingoeca rosetta]EGD83607.1 hypothetical protein PTSG_04215 [Salpingoeca rosetta]|eukprot:XP_004995111.1 hypothetical protein PTSG_04215 [Salpingoeca rosetta]